MNRYSTSHTSKNNYISLTNQPSHLRCWAHNPNSLSNKKKTELLLRFASQPSEKPHLLFFCETKYGSNSVPNIAGYYYYRQDRDDMGTGGGVCIYVSEEIKSTTVQIESLQQRDIEQTWCIVHLGIEKILVGCIYRPPHTSLANHLKTTELIVEKHKIAKRAVKTLNCTTMFVYGDFNLPNARFESIDVNCGFATIGRILNTSNNSSEECFLEGLQELDLQHIVTFPTYRDSLKVEATNTLDLVITDDPTRLFALEQDAPLGSTPKGRAHYVINGT